MIKVLVLFIIVGLYVCCHVSGHFFNLIFSSSKKIEFVKLQSDLFWRQLSGNPIFWTDLTGLKGGNTVQPFLNLELIKEVWGLIKWGSIEKDPGDTKLEKLENVGHKVGLTLTVSNNYNRFLGCLEIDRSTDQKKEGSSVGGLSEVKSDGYPV